MTVGQRIRAARNKAGLTQRELAARAETATGTIQQYELEKRQPRLEQLRRIANVLGVDINWLMNGHTMEERDAAFKASADQRYRDAKEWLRQKKMDEAFQGLNEQGQQKAVERVEELTEIPKYKKE